MSELQLSELQRGKKPKLGQEQREIATLMESGQLEPWEFALALHEIYPTEPGLLAELYQSEGGLAMITQSPYIFGPPHTLGLQSTMESIQPGFTGDLTQHLRRVTGDPAFLEQCADGLQVIHNPRQRSAIFHKRLVGPVFRPHLLHFPEAMLQEAMLGCGELPYPTDDLEAARVWLEQYLNSPERDKMMRMAQNGFGNPTWHHPSIASEQAGLPCMSIAPVLPAEFMAVHRHAAQFNTKHRGELPDGLSAIARFGKVIAPEDGRSMEFFRARGVSEVNSATIFKYCTQAGGYLHGVKDAHNRSIPRELTVFDVVTAKFGTKYRDSLGM